MAILSTKYNITDILIVDDEAVIREYLRIEIEDNYKNVSIVEAVDGNEALIKAQNQKFDVVITDLRMPNLGGASLVKHLGRLPEKLRPKKVIVFSGFIDESTKELGKASNVSFLSKPINLELFLQYLDEILYKKRKKPTAAKSTMEVQFINPFIDGMIEVMGMLCDTIPEVSSKTVRQPDESLASDISSVVYMSSDLFTGSLAIGFPTETYKNIYKMMLGEDIQEINNKNCDGVGEICNQVFGHAKTKLNEKGFNIQMAIPSVIYGDGHKVKHLINGPCLSLQFTSDAGEFFLEVTVKSSRQ